MSASYGTEPRGGSEGLRTYLFGGQETGGTNPSGGGEPSSGEALEDAARSERDYVRERLREESGREPTEEEVSEWLRRHTEGY